jgi:hypothetical protein
MVGRLIGYLSVCDPPDQTIAELADALLASRSAITGAVKTLEARAADHRGGITGMSALACTAVDSRTLLRRNLRRLKRYPSLTVMLIGMPIVFLLLFVYVFGGQLGHGLSTGLAGGHAGRAGYLNYRQRRRIRAGAACCFAHPGCVGSPLAALGVAAGADPSWTLT